MPSLQAVLDDQGVAATDFVGLSDTPAALGTTGQIPAVNAAGDALEFVDTSAGGGTGSDPEILFDNHPTLVQIGTLASSLTTTVTSLTLAALPTETVVITDFLLIDSEVI